MEQLLSTNRGNAVEFARPGIHPMKFKHNSLKNNPTPLHISKMGKPPPDFVAETKRQAKIKKISDNQQTTGKGIASLGKSPEDIIHFSS